MKKLIICLVLLSFGLTGFVVSCGSEDSPEKTVSKSEPKDVVEVAKQNLIDVAKVMGGFDQVYAQNAITFAESGAGWSFADEEILPATPETQAAYRKYRSAVLSQK